MVPPLATTCVEYGVPLVPGARDSVVIDSDKAMLIVKAFWAVSAGVGDESVTVTVKVLRPSDPFGVPEIIPVEGFRVRPGGSVPLDTAHV